MTQSTDIRESVLTLLASHAGSDVELTDDTRIMADTKLDSVAVMDFVLDLEDHFDITIPLNRLAEITTVRELIAAVQKLSSDD